MIKSKLRLKNETKDDQTQNHSKASLAKQNYEKKYLRARLDIISRSFVKYEATLMETKSRASGLSPTRSTGRPMMKLRASPEISKTPPRNSPMI